MFKKVLFCIPQYAGVFGWPGAPHPGVGYLSQFLSDHDIDNTVIDMRLGYTVNDVIKKARQFGADLIGVSLMSFKHDTAYKLVNDIKKAGFTVVIGGPHISTLRAKVLEECEADLAIKMEGEYALLELCKGKKPKQIKNLIYKENGKIIENEDRGPIINLDGIPFPTYEKFELEKYRSRSIPIVSSRGCPYKCIYCPIKVTMGRMFRFRSPKNIFKEVKYWEGRSYTYFQINDDNFTMIKERVSKFCDMIIKSGMKVLFAADNGVRADRVDYDILKKMRKAGFKYISFGVEAGTDRVLKVIKKGENLESIDKAIKISVDLGFEVTLFFLLGSPTETEEDIKESIKLTLKYKIKDVRFYNIIPFPQTELYDWIKENDYFLKDPKTYLNDSSHWDDEPVFKTPELSYEDRKKLLTLTKKIRQRIRRRWFKRKISDMGLMGKIVAPILQYEFIRDPILNSKLIERGLLISFTRKITEKIFK